MKNSLLFVLSLTLALTGSAQASKTKPAPDVEALAERAAAKIVLNVSLPKPRRLPNAALKVGPPPERVIDELVANNSAALRACYMRHGMKSGRIALELRVSHTGNIWSAKVAAPGLNHYAQSNLDRCVKSVIRHWTLPAGNDNLTLTYPLVYLQTQAPGAGPTRR